MAERILARGEQGAGGWLESACKGDPHVPRGDPADHGHRARGRGRRPHAAGGGDPRGGGHLVHPAALLGPRRADARAPPGLPGGGARAVDADPAADRRQLGVLLLHARVRAARRARLRLGGGRAVLGDADLRLLLGRERARRGGGDARDAVLLSADRGGGRGPARAARPPGRDRVRAGRAVRAHAARARHARLAGQDRVGHGLRRAGARAPDRARPGGRRRGGAAAGRGRAAGDPRGARDHRRAARRRRRAAPADRGARGGGAALERGQRRARGDDGRRASASCTRSPRASSSGSCARRSPTSSATPARARSPCGCGGSAAARC